MLSFPWKTLFFSDTVCLGERLYVIHSMQFCHSVRPVGVFRCRPLAWISAVFLLFWKFSWIAWSGPHGLNSCGVLTDTDLSGRHGNPQLVVLFSLLDLMFGVVCSSHVNEQHRGSPCNSWARGPGESNVKYIQIVSLSQTKNILIHPKTESP